MKELIDYQKARIEALQTFIDEKDKTIDELKFQLAESKARFNMLVRNIEVIDEIIEKPIRQ